MYPIISTYIQNMYRYKYGFYILKTCIILFRHFVVLNFYFKNAELHYCIKLYQYNLKHLIKIIAK